jgi:dolichyl-diphosphooligosaccharide--protein glycosyltransferase
MGEHTSMRKRRGINLVLVVVLFIGAGVRLLPYPEVFTPEGIRFVADDDPYYHVLRAKRIVDDFPNIPWEDPLMNYPTGAAILWPPLFDIIIAWTAMITSLGQPSPEFVERVAAFVPLFFGVVTLPLVAMIGRQLVSEGVGLLAAFLVALLPAHVTYSVLGRPDHHVTEALFFAWVFAAFVASVQKRPGGSWNYIAPVLLGFGIALSFWNWNGSGLYLLFLVLISGLWYVGAPHGDPASSRMTATLFKGGIVGAAFLAPSLLVFGQPGALGAMTLIGVSGFQVVLTGLTACFGGLLLLAGQCPASSRLWRLAHVAAAAMGPLSIALLVLPGFGSSVVHGLTALGRGNAWYENIQEFDPLLFAGFDPLGTELLNAAKLYGVTPLIIPFAIRPILRQWRASPQERPFLFFLVLWGCVFLALAFAQKRFAIYFVLPLSVLTALACREIYRWLSIRVRDRRLCLALALSGGVGLLSPTLLWFAERGAGTDPPPAEIIRALEWLRRESPTTPGHEGVLAEWSYGHLIEYFSSKPTVANPFGTDLGPGAMEDSAAFFLARNPRSAEAIVERRRIGFVLLANPLTESYFSLSFAPPDTLPAVAVARDWLRGFRVEVKEDFWTLVVSRLYFFDGMARFGIVEPPLASYRLIYESPTKQTWMGLTTSTFKIFAVVPGALLAVKTEPFRTVAATARLMTNQGRLVNYRAAARADASGFAKIRLPYATGANGTVKAFPYAVTDGITQRSLSVSNAQVTGNLVVEVNLR